MKYGKSNYCFKEVRGWADKLRKSRTIPIRTKAGSVSRYCELYRWPINIRTMESIYPEGIFCFIWQVYDWIPTTIPVFSFLKRKLYFCTSIFSRVTCTCLLKNQLFISFLLAHLLFIGITVSNVALVKLHIFIVQLKMHSIMIFERNIYQMLFYVLNLYILFFHAHIHFFFHAIQYFYFESQRKYLVYEFISE